MHFFVVIGLFFSEIVLTNLNFCIRKRKKRKKAKKEKKEACKYM